jgi:hypothetical protein
MSNLRDALSKYFETFDTLRDELSRTVEGWDTPVVVIFGPQNAGKSTLLERLAMMPLFPKGDGLCTRVPIRIRLRNGVEQAPELSIFERKGTHEHRMDKTTIQGDIEQNIRRTMERLVGIQSSSAQGVRKDRLIQVELRGPRYPNIDLLDLPGLVVNAANVRGGASDLPEQTMSLAKEVLSEVKGRALYLAVREAGTQVDHVLTTNVLMDIPDIKASSFGVLTKADDAADDKILRELKSSGDWGLKYGCFVTMGKPLEGAVDFEALRDAERAWFEETSKRQQILQNGRAGCDELVRQLAAAYHDYLGKTWYPNTQAQIERSKAEQRAHLEALGVPVGGHPTPELVAAVGEVLWSAQERARAIAKEACVVYGLKFDLWAPEVKPGDQVFPLEHFAKVGLGGRQGLEATLKAAVAKFASEVLASAEDQLLNTLKRDSHSSAPFSAVRVARFERLLDRVRASCGDFRDQYALDDECAALVERFMEAHLSYTEAEVTLSDFERLRHAAITFGLRMLARWSPSLDVAAWSSADPLLFEDSTAEERGACASRLRELDSVRASLDRIFGGVAA